MFGILVGKPLELYASEMLVCHCEMPSMAVCQGRVMEGRKQGDLRPYFLHQQPGTAVSQALQWQGKKPLPKRAVLSPLPRHVRVRVVSEAGRRLGWVSHLCKGNLFTHRSLAFLGKQRLSPRHAWAPEKPHLGLCYRSNFFWNGLPFKCNGLLVVLWGQRVNKIIFVCYGIA